MNDRKIKRLLKTSIIAFFVTLVWMLLELLIYKQIQPRIVDDIMMIIFIPIIWKSIEKEGEKDER